MTNVVITDNDKNRRVSVNVTIISLDDHYSLGDPVLLILTTNISDSQSSCTNV